MTPDVEVLKLMEEIGGGFVSALATAWMRADANNQELLMSAFFDYYNSYNLMLMARKRRES